MQETSGKWIDYDTAKITSDNLLPSSRSSCEMLSSTTWLLAILKIKSDDTTMWLGSFRVRLIAALFMLLVIWQSARFWKPSLASREEIEEPQVMENGGIQTHVVKPLSQLQKVLIGVYYEALCPDSRSFVLKQLEPTYQALKGHVTIMMVPYGKATTTKGANGFEFMCQHGPLECEANIIHACAIDSIKDETLELEFLACMIKNNLNPQNITKTCGERLHVDPEPILNCSKDSKGKGLLAMYGKMTDALRPSVGFIPTITLDQNSDNQPAILKNLLKEVCLLFKVAPEGCKN